MLERNAVRAILLTPDDAVLLMRIRLPGRADSFWVTPGGGLDPGETFERGLRRELNEELGLERFEVGPLLWLRQHTFDFDGRRICQNERYYLVQVPRFEPSMTDAVEARVLQEFRWWQLAELAATRESISPISLASIVSNYLALGAPSEPLALEVLVD
jgi:8-oxo-dGTP pyrophosphatase MutT (NUDIX family)